MSSRPLSAVVLAAGEGTRMRSTRPKPLHLLCGRPMVLHVLDALAELRRRPRRRRRRPRRRAGHQDAAGAGAAGPAARLRRAARAAGHGRRRVGRRSPPSPTTTSTTTATSSCSPATRRCCGRRRWPPWSASTAPPARPARSSPPCLDDPTGYGRVVRGKDDRVARIVEQADATDDEREIDEINTSIYCFRRSVLAPALRRLSPDNAQGEYYLTDVVEVLHDAGYPSWPWSPTTRWRRPGVNDRAQLAVAEAELRDRTNERWMRRGVTMLDPERTYIDATGRAGPRRHPLPGHDPAGAHGDRRAAPRSAPTPASSTASWARAPSSSRPSAARPRSVPTPWSGRSRCSSPAPKVAPGPSPGPFYTATGDGDDEGGAD